MGITTLEEPYGQVTNVELRCLNRELSMYSFHPSPGKDCTLIIKRIYDGGGTIPYSELFCCGETDNLHKWTPSDAEAGYYKLDREYQMIRLACPPAGPIIAEFWFIPKE